MNTASPIIYFHVGLGKTATTYLQYRFFPKLQGIYYIQRTRYPKAKQIIAEGKHATYLVSREFDQQLEGEVKKFATTYPHTTPIIVLRRQDGWIASQYRRFVKNGYRFSFQEFLDLEQDKGYFKQSDLRFYDKIKLLEQYFTQLPMVLFHEDLKTQAYSFFDQLAQGMGATYERSNINMAVKHSSYNEQQLKAMYALSQRLPLQKRRVFDNAFLHTFWKLGLGAVRYGTLYGAKALPSSFFDDKPLILASELERVRSFFAEDWAACCAYTSPY